MELVRLSGIAKTYNSVDPVSALREIDLSIEQGSFVSLQGTSGSGKSTLLNILGLLDQPDSGSYVFQEREMMTSSEAVRTSLRARDIGFVFQSFHLLSHKNAIENVATGLLYRDDSLFENRELPEMALESVGLSHRKFHRPAELSGGERQRVALARAVVGKPKLVLCDEPTGNLDRKNANLILSLLRSICDEGITVIIVTHDREIADSASDRYILDDGRIAKR